MVAAMSSARDRTVQRGPRDDTSGCGRAVETDVASGGGYPGARASARRVKRLRPASATRDETGGDGHCGAPGPRLEQLESDRPNGRRPQDRPCKSVTSEVAVRRFLAILPIAEFRPKIQAGRNICGSQVCAYLKSLSR